MYPEPAGVTAKSGEQRVYESVLVRRTYRDGAKVRHETLANLSALPAEAMSAIEATLKGERLVPAGQRRGSPPRRRRAVVAVHAAAVQLGLPALLGPAGRQRDLALALIISRVVNPASKLSTLTWWNDKTWAPISASPMPAPMTSTPRWTGWSTGRT